MSTLFFWLSSQPLQFAMLKSDADSEATVVDTESSPVGGWFRLEQLVSIESLTILALLLLAIFVVLGAVLNSKTGDRARWFAVALTWLSFPYIATKRVANLILRGFRLSANFFQFVFDIDITTPEGDRIGDHERKENDTRRMLHFAWHSGVFFPVIVVCAVALVMKADLHEILFFFCLAASTVSLEICIGIVIEKTNQLEDLSKQTTRAIQGNLDQEQLIGWIRYFQMRHHLGKQGIAKAALVTTISIVLFSSIVGIEALRMLSHTLPSKAELQTLFERHDDRQLDANDFTDLVYERLHRDDLEETRLLSTATIFATLLISIAAAKLWIQTRQCLEERDAMDRFSSWQAALDSLKSCPLAKHFADEDRAGTSPKITTRTTALSDSEFEI